jgi:hypothetical protein
VEAGPATLARSALEKGKVASSGHDRLRQVTWKAARAIRLRQRSDYSRRAQGWNAERRGYQTATTTTEQNTSMKEKSSKQSKKAKAGVELKDLTPTKDSKGQLRRGREMPGGMEPVRRLGSLL